MKRVDQRGLVTAGRRGRPPVAEATIEMLLDSHLRLVQERAGLRARRRPVRKIDATARAGLAALFARVGTGSMVRYRPIDEVLKGAFPQHRPPQRAIDTVRFCEEGLLRPAVHVDGELEAIREPSPLLVPGYVYGWGGL